MAKKKVSKSQQRRRDARAAARNTPATEMQITPKSFQVTPDTETPNIRFTAAEKASGDIYGTDIGNGLTAYTRGAVIKDPSVLRQQIGLPATPETAANPAAADSTVAGKKGKGRKKLTIRGVKVGKSLSGEEAMKLAATGLGERAIDKALAKGASIQGSAERRLTKGQLATPEQRLLGSVFDTQRQDMNGGLMGSGIPSVLNPRSKDVQALRGLGLEKGQRFVGATGSGAPILATKDMLGGTGGGGGGKAPTAEPEATADTTVADTGTGPILPKEEEEEDVEGGLMTGSVEAGRSALGIKRRRSRAQRLRLTQLGTSRLNRLKIRSMLNLPSGGGVSKSSVANAASTIGGLLSNFIT